MEFLCIEDDSCLAYTDEKVNGSPPGQDTMVKGGGYNIRRSTPVTVFGDEWLWSSSVCMTTIMKKLLLK